MNYLGKQYYSEDGKIKAYINEQNREGLLKIVVRLPEESIPLLYHRIGPNLTVEFDTCKCVWGWCTEAEITEILERLQLLIDFSKYRVLHLTLKKKWFEMIRSGEKIEEYRSTTPYWNNRLRVKNAIHPAPCVKFDYIKFTNGYRKDSPSFIIKCENLLLTWGKPEWGGSANNLHYVFKLGTIIQKAY